VCSSDMPASLADRQRAGNPFQETSTANGTFRRNRDPGGTSVRHAQLFGSVQKAERGPLTGALDTIVAVRPCRS
jgi:hypothetical protein